MSMIEDTNALYPLFSSQDIANIDLNAAGLVPDSPSKFAFLKKASGGFLTNSQAITEEPLFSLFLSGGIAGLDESLLAGIVPDAAVPKMEGIPRQYMSIVPDTQSMDVNQPVVPQMSSPAAHTQANAAAAAASATNNAKQQANGNRRGSDAKKRKFINNAPSVKMEGGGSGEQSLSPDEERSMKRQRRLVKNREAAQLFRQRQKAYIQDLEKKVQDLSGTNNELRARVELLNSENKLIKEQLLYLRNFVTQAVSFSFPKGSVSAPPGMPTVGGIPAGIASLALGNLANSPNLQGSMASMLSAVTGPLPAGLLGPSSLSGHSSMSPMSSMASVSSSHTHLPPMPVNVPQINIIPPQQQQQQQQQNIQQQSTQQQQQQQQRPLSPLMNVDSKNSQQQQSNTNNTQQQSSANATMFSPPQLAAGGARK